MKVLKNYRKPTPKKWRAIGDALLILSGTFTVYAMSHDYELLEICSVVCGIGGKFLTNFFAEEG